MYNEDDFNLCMNLINPGEFTFSMHADGADMPSWDQVEATYQRGQLSGAAKGFLPPPRADNKERQDVTDTRCNWRRFDFMTMDPPNWYLGKVNHALDVVVPVDDNGNHYISIMLHYFNNENYDGVWVLGKKVVDGTEVGLTEEERIRLGIGISFDDIPRK